MQHHLPAGIRAVLFDAGDTLLAPEPSFQRRFHDIARDWGETFDEAEVARAYAAGLRRAVWPTDWSDAAGQRAFWTDFYTGVLTDLGADGDRVRLATIMFEAFSDPAAYQLFPDVLGVLDTLAARGLTLGVISNFEPWLEDVLVLQGVRERFATVAISGVLRVAKPEPEIFHTALAEAGTSPGQAVYVGDSPAADVEGAAAVGMHPVLIDRFNRYPLLDGVPRITTLTELPDLLDGTAPAGG